ncbi:MAG: bactofilin family protein [Bacillota bacterium]|jgi:cytoskeletal protein CcmA (bactofilin family)|nr:polymer-forming cytoskeletal protein [Candidatus Fermentithermobacillaceae bacterium]
MFGRTTSRKQTSVLAMSSDFVGHLAYSGTLEILGRVEGDITVSGKVIVGPSGSCISNIKADAVEIHGEVQGNVETMVLKLAAGGTLVGDAKYKSIIMEEGSVFQRIVPDAPEKPVETEAATHPGSPASTVSEGQGPTMAEEERDTVAEKQVREEAASDKEPQGKQVPGKKPCFQTVF